MKKFGKRIVTALICTSLMLSGCGASANNGTENSNVNENNQSTAVAQSEEGLKYQKYAGMTVEEIVNSLTLEQKAAQMVQPAIYNVTEGQMQDNCYGSILSKTESFEYSKWQETVDGYQESAISSDAGIPYIYGQDDVHGVNYCSGAVIYPHNIGVGAANDPELLYQIGLATADEAKLCHMMWNFAPCLAQSEDPRWGRTYESYGSDLEMIKKLGVSYTKGLIDGGVVACAKHFFGDGNVEYGTGENSDSYRLIDRGDSTLTDEEISKLLEVYKAEIDAGVQTIMISHSSLNGLKMHENEKYIQYLKNEMGFTGFIVSDWNSVQNTSPTSYYDQIVTSVNAGIDMLMEVDTYDAAMDTIIRAVKSGDISEERVNDAVSRIIKVKKDIGLFDDPLLEKMETKEKETGSKAYRELAEKMVEESLVLVKNDNNLLPLKEGMKIYVTGPAADDHKAQCGGWTIDWNESYLNRIPGVTSILDGLNSVGKNHNITFVTDPNEAADCDAVILVVGERSYAEWYGDTEDLELCGTAGLSGNSSAIDKVKALNKPTITLIVAGRNVIIDDYYEDWDSIVMCYLPGSEGQGVAKVLCKDAEFSGKLPSPWYNSVSQIGTGESWLPVGYGLTY